MKHASQGVLNSIWKITNLTLHPHELKIVSQNEKYFEGFERLHMKTCLEWFEMPCIGVYSGLFEITLVFGSCMQE
jgi:hypothetical protein